MVNEKLECLLKYINGSLERYSEEELAYLIKIRILYLIQIFIDSKSYLINQKILLLRRAHLEVLFFEDSTFFNCTFFSCSFITAVFESVKFINYKFENYIFFSIYSENNIQENCIFIDSYTDSGLIKESQ